MTLECAIETLRAALNVLASAAPDWLRARAETAWVERYAKRAEEDRIPQAEAKRRAYVEQIGRDGHHLLAAIPAPKAPAWLRTIPTVELLRQVWVQNFYCVSPAIPPEPGASSPAGAVVQWRTDAEGFPPSLLMVASPYDAEVHTPRSGRRPGSDTKFT